MEDPKVNLPFQSLHLIGIGGAGMNPLAHIACELGMRVTGSDQFLPSEIIPCLAQAWSPHDIGHWSYEGQALPEAVVISTAISPDNPELVYLRDRNVPIMHRSDLLQVYANLFPGQIVISGTHGKTTTTALLAWILESCNYPVSWVLGGVLTGARRAYGWNSRAKAFLLEGDESDQSFLKPQPDYGLVTCLEPDHLENYQNSFQVQIQKFQDFARKSGFFICGTDCPNARQYLAPLTQRTYAGSHSEADWVLDSQQGVYFQGKLVGTVHIPKAPGRHNALNALAAVALAAELGLPPKAALDAISLFPGVYRRFEQIGHTRDGIRVIDDYAHHPSEIKAVIQCARSLLKAEGRLLVAFQPHLPTRLRDLWEEFKLCFEGADRVWINDLYIARGKEIDGINSARLVEEINQTRIKYIAGKPQNLIEPLLAFVQPHDLILTLGAGDITGIRETLFKQVSSAAITDRIL